MGAIANAAREDIRQMERNRITKLEAEVERLRAETRREIELARAEAERHRRDFVLESIDASNLRAEVERLREALVGLYNACGTYNNNHCRLCKHHGKHDPGCPVAVLDE